MRAVRRVRMALGLVRLLPVFLALGLVKHLVPLPLLLRWATRRRARRTRDPALVAKLVLRTSALCGTADRDCLQRSLLLFRELVAAGHPAELCFGITRDQYALQGHAWICLDGQRIGDPAVPVVRFEELVRFGANGARRAASELR